MRSIIEVASRHGHYQQQTHGVYQDVTLATLDLLAAVVADIPAHFRRLDRLGVDAGGAGCFFSPCGRADLPTQGIEDLLPGAIFLPGNEVIPNGTLGEKVVRQIVPLAAGTSLILDRVDHLAQIHRTRPTAGFARRK